jgi:catechol 2,3-dioxygenase-like lactoylglutathione lyase family enzyme
MMSFDASTHDWAGLVPELNVTDIAVSLRFWRDLLGFTVLYDRPEQGFAYLAREGAEVMLERLDETSWHVGEMARPFGRGINLQIGVSAIQPMLDALAAADWPLYLPPRERWYRAGDQETGQRQFLVQDPDGYLLRFAESLGQRPVQDRS